MQSLNESIFCLPFPASSIRNCFWIRHGLLRDLRLLRDLIAGLDPGLGYGILGLASAYGKPQLARRFTRLAHERASGELSYSENWFEKLSFAVPSSLFLATSLPCRVFGAVLGSSVSTLHRSQPGNRAKPLAHLIGDARLAVHLPERADRVLGVSAPPHPTDSTSPLTQHPSDLTHYPSDLTHCAAGAPRLAR